MPIRMPEVAYDVVALKGGLDQITPPLSLKPGVAREAVNFECAPTGGYTRIAGYERYDGQAKPSAAVYSYVAVTAFTNTPTVGQTLTGATSLATGQIIALTAAYMVLTLVSGSFSTTEVVKVGATTIGTATSMVTAVTALEMAQYQNLAADVYRALINKVPGSGSVRGVVGLTVSGVDKVYAFRDNAGATAVDLYVGSAMGWTQIAFKHKVAFTAGNAAVPANGETLTQGGVTSTVRRVMASSGSLTWAASNTAGQFVIDTPTGGSFAAGAATLSGGATVTLSGANAAITLATGGRFEFAPGNLAGSTSTLRLYGCDGVNLGFEFDGTIFAPIPTGATTDTPSHVVIHKNHLIWGIASSAVFSGPGTPFRYLAADNGGEIAVSDTITNFLTQPGEQTTGALAIFSRSSTGILYGTGLATWNFVPFASGTGGLHYTAQNLAQSYVFDDNGVISIAATLAYGNFEQATLTNGLKTFINSERTKVAYSSLRRDKSQYRVFFTDGYGLYVTIVNGKLLGCMPVLYLNTVYCAWQGEAVDGSEVSYFGDTSGYVHQLDVGSSFDGAAIDASVTLNWNAMKSPRVLKRFRHASVEMTGNYYAAIQFGYQLGYGTTERGQPTAVAYASGFTAAPAWDSFTWDAFVWDGRTIFPTEVDVRGTGENLQVTISSATDYIYPYTVNSVITQYTPRRGMR